MKIVVYRKRGREKKNGIKRRAKLPEGTFFSSQVCKFFSSLKRLFSFFFFSNKKGVVKRT